MKITDIKINGIREPMGFALPYTDVSFKVTETPSRRPDIIRIELADDYGKVLASREDTLSGWNRSCRRVS